MPTFTPDYLPVYFQAVKGAGPVRSGVDILPMSLFISSSALTAGACVAVVGKYRPFNLIGWILFTTGFGLLMLMKADIDQPKWVGYQILVGAGMGVLVRVIPVPMYSVHP